MKRFVLVWLLFGSALSAQVEYSTGVNVVAGSTIFFMDIAGFKSSAPNKTRIDVFVQVPYSSVQFIKRPDGYYAAYSITLTFFDQSKKNILFERNWREKLKTDEFAQTTSKNNFNLSYKTYDLQPGNYFLRCIFEDVDSRRTALREIPIKVRAISDSLGLSDLVFVSEVIKDSTGDNIVANVSTTVTNKNNSLSFFFNIYSNKEEEIYLEYLLTDLKKNTTLKQLDPRKIKPGANLVLYTLNYVKFSLGDYSLRVLLKDKDEKEISSVEKKLSSIIYGIPSSITDLNKAVEQMIYIASPQELDFIKEAKEYEEKMNRFLAFWEKKKPNPKLDENPILYEYYRRIEYANKNFKGFGEGWRSDMGMIYVTFGPPSAVQRHPMDSNSRPYEIWEYFELNRSFVFIDQTGFGDYRLANPDYSRWPGYRP